MKDGPVFEVDFPACDTVVEVGQLSEGSDFANELRAGWETAERASLEGVKFVPVVRLSFQSGSETIFAERETRNKQEQKPGATGNCVLLPPRWHMA